MSLGLVEGAGLDLRPRQVVVRLGVVGIELEQLLEGGDGSLGLMVSAA